MSDTTGIVVFDYPSWVQRFPQFSNAPPEPTAQMFFDEACLILNNTPESPVQPAYPKRSIMLNLLTAHIATINGWPQAAGGGSSGSSGSTGILTSATEGSVSVSFQPLVGTDAGAMRTWLSQTQYGAEYYALSMPYRSARYYPGRQPYLGVGPRYFGRGDHWW